MGVMAGWVGGGGCTGEWTGGRVGGPVRSGVVSWQCALTARCDHRHTVPRLSPCVCLLRLTHPPARTPARPPTHQPHLDDLVTTAPTERDKARRVIDTPFQIMYDDLDLNFTLFSLPRTRRCHRAVPRGLCTL